MSIFASTHVPAGVNTEETAPSKEQLAQPQRGARERELLQVFCYTKDFLQIFS